MGNYLAKFTGKKFLVLGAGSIASTFLPMLLRHIDVDKEKIVVLSEAHMYGHALEELGIAQENIRLTPDTFEQVFSERLSAGDMVLNLTGGVSAIDLVTYCLNNGINYLDTSNERWEHGALHNDAGDYSQQWNKMIGMRPNLPKNSTALVSHGANPGIVNHFAKQAVEDLARANGVWPKGDHNAVDWADLAQKLGVRTLHISERDTQTTKIEEGIDDFFNTWSIEGLLEEAESTPYFAWGSHEELFDDLFSRRDPVSTIAAKPALAKDCHLTSWLPGHGCFEAALIPHEETFSIAELFSDPDGTGYQPTVLFAYRPCDLAYDRLQQDYSKMKPRVLIDEIADGIDELGILVLREGTEEVYWYGSTLDVHEARSLVPFTNATSLQVAAGVLGGLVWLLNNPPHGLVSAEMTDHHQVLDAARPYLGRLEGVYGQWDDAPTKWLMRDLMKREA